MAVLGSPSADPAAPRTRGRALLVSSLRRRGMTGVQTHLAEAEHLLADRYERVAVVSLDALLPVGAGARILAAHAVGRLPYGRARFHQWRAVARALELAVARSVRRDPPDVVYAQDTRSAGAALAARGGTDYAVVMVVHYNESEAGEMVGLGNVRPDSRQHRLLWEVERDVLRRLDGIVFVSDFMRRHVLDEVPEIADIPVCVLPNCLAPVPGPHPAPPVLGDIVSVGMLVPRKNHEYLLDVVAAARAAGHDRRLTIVGAGPLAGVLAQRAERLAITDLVTFTGRRDDVDDLLRGHRVYVHSAHMENAPYALIEAMRAGLPVVTSAVGGIPEVVGAGGAARFWPLDDPAAGADVLARLLDDPVALADASAAASQRFDSVFAESVSGEWLGDFLAEVSRNHSG